MDAMVNHYTAGKKRRSSDAYTPDAAPGRRPDYAAAVYARKLRKLFPDVPIVIGGARASSPVLASAHHGGPAARWLLTLGLYDLLFGLIAYALFDFLVED